MTKVSALVREALFASGVVGIGQNPNSEDSNRAFTQLNYLLADWRTKRMLLYRDKTVSFTGTGAGSYTLGPSSATVTTNRPNQIRSAFRRQLSGTQFIDVSLLVLRSINDYNSITMKNLGSVPACVFYDATFPNGTVFVWPNPSSIYEIHLSFSDVIEAFANLNEEISLPPEYESALHWNLSEKLRTTYRKPPDPMISKEAKSSRRTLRNANPQIKTLNMPAGLPIGDKGGYNIYSDTIG